MNPISFNHLLILISLFLTSHLMGQTEDPVLFTVGSSEVKASEFDYIYKKNNGDNATFEKEDVESYLDLYVKFKLKVQKAKALKLDTIKALQDELAVYRKQLAASYLVDKEVKDKLVEELYERIQKDKRVSHVLFSLADDADETQVQEALNNMLTLKGKVDRGAPFVDIAKTISDDQSSAANGGELGWMTAMLPNGFYEFENAIYTLKPGEVSEPIRTQLGYHLIKVEEERKARGEIEVAHILIRTRKKGQDVKDANSQIDSLYGLLQKGDDFKYLAKNFSEDRNTSNKEGYLGFFGISQYEKAFEDAAFGLKNVGDISEPVKTSIGWHIIKLLNRKDYEDQDRMKRALVNKIEGNERFEIAQDAIIKQIQIESGMTENKGKLTSFIGKVGDNFFSYKWKSPDDDPSELMSFKDKKYSVNEFGQYCKREVRKRLGYKKDAKVGDAVIELYNAYKKEKTLKYEEENLEKKYPEFKSLMREYSEGILLFEATKKNVWDKASEDTIGLNSFFDRNKGAYVWNERGVLSTYNIHTVDEKKLKDIHKQIKKKTPEEILKKYNTDVIIVEHRTSTHEMGSKEFLGLKWKKGATTDPIKDKKGKSFIVKKLNRMIEPGPKTMDDARGYIIADYQDELEQEWVETLKKEFDVQIHEEVLKSMFK